MPNAVIVVVEDDWANQQLFQILLEDFNYVVLAAANGQELLDILESRDVDLIIMDIAMPVMSGLEATKRIRSMVDAKAAIPIIAVSAHSSRDDRQVFEAAGVNAFFSKPIAIPQLLKTVGQLLLKP